MAKRPVQPKSGAGNGIVVVGLDPGTWHVGWSAWKDGEWLTAGTLEADSRDPHSRDGKIGYLHRLQDLGSQVVGLLKQYKPNLVVVEEPSSFGRGHRSQSRLTLTVGFLAGTVKGFGTEVRFARVEQWYPRMPGTRKRANKEVAVAILQRKFGQVSEHALMATGMVDWFLNGRDD